jgi:site-specific DNA-cytosine methylase
VRLYWTNIPGLIQPEDKGLVLKDIIEDGVSDILSDKEMAYMLRSENTNKHTPRINRARSENQKSNTLTNSMYKGVPHGVIQRPITQPKDKGIVLKDILEDVVNDEYNAGQHLLDGYKGGDQLNPNYKSQANTIHRNKTATLCAGTHGYSNGYVERPCELKEFNQDSTCHHAATATDIKGNESIKRVYASSGKSPTLTTMGGGHREPKVLCGRIVGRKINPNTGKRDDYNPDLKAEQRLEPRLDEKSGTLTTVQKDNVVITHPTYRKLTPLECERLQTVPDGYTSGVSNTQRYKLLGNGFTVDVIKHILQEMIQ